MPWYDYKCTKCNHIKNDVKRSITENVSSYICPKCGGEMKQIFTQFGFDLKGTGWFKSGYFSTNSIKKKEEIDDLHK